MTTPDPMQPPAELAPDATVTPTPTEPHHDVRERAARALYEHRQATNDFPPDGYTTWDDLPEEWQDEYREAADAVLAAVSAAAPDERVEVEQERDDRRAWMRAALDLQAKVRQERARAEVAEAALAALREQYRDLATYRTTHANLGLCPEGPDDPARDPDCPVCAALAAAPSETEEGR